jgi:hypothetical protein
LLDRGSDFASYVDFDERLLTSASGLTYSLSMSAFVVRDARGRSPFWYAVYRDATGRRLKKSTGLTSKSKALEIARTLDKASSEARQQRLTEARTRELLSEVLQSVSGESLRVFTVADWFAHFSAQKVKSRAGQTAARHLLVMREFVEFLGARARLNIAAMTSKDVTLSRSPSGSLPTSMRIRHRHAQQQKASLLKATTTGSLSGSRKLAKNTAVARCRRRNSTKSQRCSALS